MKKEEITALFGKFESISCEVEGIECWSARELQPLLDCDMLLQRGIKPEQLSPDEDIKKVQRKINKDTKKSLKNK